MLSTVRPLSVIHTDVPDRGKLVTLIASKRHRLLFAGDDDSASVARVWRYRNLFIIIIIIIIIIIMTRSLNVAPKTTEQNLIVRSV